MTQVALSVGEWFGAVGVVVGVLSLLVGIEFVVLPRRARQELLDRLPDPERGGWEALSGTRTLDEQRDFVLRNGVDLATLNASLASRPKQIQRALRHLIGEGKVEVLLFRGVADDNHPEIPAGALIVMPIVFKGALPPELRARPEEILRILSSL